jgi:hypothetical protein
MGTDLNSYFVTFKVFQGDSLVKEFQCPKSMIQSMFYLWKYPGTPYKVQIVDHLGILRLDSDCVPEVAY